MSKKNYTLSQLHAIYIVYRDLDVGTRTVNCATCGKTLYINNIEDCYLYYGHRIARSIEPKLKYHPLNAFPQCINCNMQVSSSIDKAYNDFIVYRFGKDITNDLLQDNRFIDQNYAKDYYINRLLELSNKFPELKDILIDYSTGSLLDTVEKDIDNSIIDQWFTYSLNYTQDLDYITNFMKTEAIEYERF